MKKYPILTFYSFLFFITSGQNINPGKDEIYREDEVAKIFLTMDSLDKVFLLDDANIWSESYLPVGFTFTNTLMDTTLSFMVGIRLRGNTSRSHPKHSFKLKFKEYGGEKFFDLKNFNLKAENNDPSMMRELLTLQTFRNANVPAARAHHVEVYINKEYMGIYLNVEQIDDEFVQSRFGDDTGNLYKCIWPSTLEDDGQIFNNNSYELKTNEELDDRTILSNFIKVVNQTSDNEFEVAIEQVFDVQVFLRYLAIEALTGHWDGYSYNKNNFYLYENLPAGKIEFIPYDVDNTFGIDWIGGDWGTRNVTKWVIDEGARPLTKRILKNAKYSYQYKEILDSLINTDFNENYFFPLLDNFKNILYDPVSRDTKFSLTFGFTFEDFLNSYTEQVARHAKYGVKSYITIRTTTAKEQLTSLLGITSPSKKIRIYPNPSNGKTISLFSDFELDESIMSISNIGGQQYQFNIHQTSSDIYQITFDRKLISGIYLIIINGNPLKILVQ